MPSVPSERIAPRATRSRENAGVTTRVVYTLGAADQLTTVNGAWLDFAADNHGAGLRPGAIIGRSIWDFIADGSTIAIYRRVFQRVRSGAGAAAFTFRCDAPAVRRLLQMHISRAASGELVLATDLVVATPRASVALLEPGRATLGTLVRMCAWCQRMPGADGQWLEVEAALAAMDVFGGDTLPRISHGMCDDCSRVMNDALDDPTPAAWQGVVMGHSTSMT